MSVVLLAQFKDGLWMTIGEFLNNFIVPTYILSSFDFNISFTTINLVLNIVFPSASHHQPMKGGYYKDPEASQTCPCEGISDI